MRLNAEEDDYFHTRLNKTSPDAKMKSKDKGGTAIIEFDGKNYTLYEAERLRDKEDRGFSSEEYYTGREFNNIGALPGNGTRIVNWNGNGISGVYLRVDRFKSVDPKTKEVHFSHPSIFVKGRLLEKELDKRCVDRLKVNAEMYKGNYKGDYVKAIKNMENGGGRLPVWYYWDAQTGHYYFAPSQYSRAVFVDQPKDFVKRANIERCSSVKNICEACALFGFIGDDSRASRVRFTDAVCQTPDPFDGSYILPILSTPRLSSFEFYLDGNGSHNFGADTAGVALRGRKFYWHDPKAHISSDDAFAKDHPKMAVKTELVKAGAAFEFSVFFDKITDDQLKKLVFALNLGNNDSPRCHKLGHGKPIGLGSVKINVDNIFKRSFENGVYSVDNVTEDIRGAAKDKLFRQSTELQAFLQRVLYFKTVGDNTVDYPRAVPKGSKGDDIFKWFAGNRGSLRSKGYIEVKQSLPKITDNSQTLQRSLPDANKSNSNYNNKYKGRK